MINNSVVGKATIEYVDDEGNDYTVYGDVTKVKVKEKDDFEFSSLSRLPPSPVDYYYVEFIPDETNSGVYYTLIDHKKTDGTKNMNKFVTTRKTVVEVKVPAGEILTVRDYGKIITANDIPGDAEQSQFEYGDAIYYTFEWDS